jgi:SAM-dependent methyltransferase
MRDAIRRLARLRPYDPTRHGLYDLETQRVYEHARQLIVPAGQSVYDPAVFGRYDRATQAVVPAGEQPELWQLRLDEMLTAAQEHSRAWPVALERDRYRLALGLLAPGEGVCLDACTGSPLAETRARVTELGYEYLPIDLEPPDGIRREDVTAMTFGDASIARILSLDTLEHVPDYETALCEFRRVLAPGGIAVVHVPCYFFDREQSAPLDPADDPWGHVRYFSGRELVATVARAGLSVLRVQLHLDYGAALVVAGRA